MVAGMSDKTFRDYSGKTLASYSRRAATVLLAHLVNEVRSDEFVDDYMENPRLWAYRMDLRSPPMPM